MRPKSYIFSCSCPTSIVLKCPTLTSVRVTLPHKPQPTSYKTAPLRHTATQDLAQSDGAPEQVVGNSDRTPANCAVHHVHLTVSLPGIAEEEKEVHLICLRMHRPATLTTPPTISKTYSCHGRFRWWILGWR
jgi:hypothetical protein